MKALKLSEAYPSLFAQWRDETDADSHRIGSNHRALWEGECGHQWRAAVRQRAAGQGCPICSGTRTVAGINDLATLRPSIAAEWDERNNKSASEVTVSSMYSALWRCPDHGHEYKMGVAQRTGGRNCPICSSRQILAGFNDLGTRNPAVAAEFVRDTEGKGRTPESVGQKSHAVFEWLCPDCGKNWVATPAARTDGGMRCRHCKGTGTVAQSSPASPPRVAARNANRPRAEVQASFASVHPGLVAQFVRDAEGKGRTPHNTPPMSKARFEWKCPICNHQWETRVGHRSKGRGCPACSGKVAVPGINDLATVHPAIAAELDDPRYSAATLTANSNLAVNWKCEKGHTWTTRVFNRTRGVGTICPTCSSKDFSSAFEREILAYVTALIPDVPITPTARSVIPRRELDVYIPDLGIAIEANGVYWHTEQFGKTVNYHRNKFLACQERGVNLITVWEDDWRDRRTAIEAMLRRHVLSSAAPVSDVRAIEQSEADEYLSAYHVDGTVNGEALGAFANDTLVGVLVYRKASGHSLRVLRFVGDTQTLTAFATHLEDEITDWKRLTYLDNAEHSDHPFLTAAGWVATSQRAPSFMLARGATRYRPAANESVKKLERIWDCGGATYTYLRRNPVADSVHRAHPELLSEWRSANIRPDETLSGSGKTVQWECENGHTWQCPVYHRTKRGRTCGQCA